MYLQNNTLESYQTKMDEFINNTIRNNMYLIELTKCCGYSCFMTIYKDESLIDLYKKVSLHFQTNDIKSLYIYRNDNLKVLVPITDLMTIRDFIMSQIMNSNNMGMTPVYEIPAQVVYRIYIQDDHCHDHSH